MRSKILQGVFYFSVTFHQKKLFSDIIIAWVKIATFGIISISFDSKELINGKKISKKFFFTGNI